MSLLSVLDAGLLWDGEKQEIWKYPAEYAPYTDYSLERFLGLSRIIAYITHLYQNSPTVAASLKRLAARGPIRIARNRKRPLSPGAESSAFLPELCDDRGNIVVDAYLSIEKDP